MSDDKPTWTESSPWPSTNYYTTSGLAMDGEGSLQPAPGVGVGREVGQQGGHVEGLGWGGEQDTAALQQAVA